MDRRDFNTTAALGTIAALQASSYGAVLGANERVRLGFIGVGNRGDQLLDAFMVHKDAEVVALCDLYQPYLEAAGKKVGGSPKLVRDYRQLLAEKGVDAAVIATPDHWHAMQFVDACQAGKDVYVEKPLSLTIAEGRRMTTVAEEAKRVTTVGLHRRSTPHIMEAVKLIRDGAIGKVTVAKCYHLRNESPFGIGNPADCAPPAGLDWDTWLGPAPKVAYNPNRCLYKFRWFSDYSGGQLTNFGTHYLDVIQWALGRDRPKSVVAMGGHYVTEDNRDIPDTMEAIWEYEGGTLATFSQFNANNAYGNQLGYEIEFRGTKGTILMQEGRGFELLPERVRTKELPALSPIARKENAEQNKAVKVAREAMNGKGRSDTADHARNFLDCVKSRQPTNCPVSVGHRSTSATLLAKIALKRGQRLEWDGNAEQVTNDAEANKLLSYEYRAPWRLA